MKNKKTKYFNLKDFFTSYIGILGWAEAKRRGKLRKKNGIVDIAFVIKCMKEIRNVISDLQESKPEWFKRKCSLTLERYKNEKRFRKI
jgi:hypothetical protein